MPAKIWHCVREWWPYIWPALSNSFFVIAGVLLCFQKVLDMIGQSKRLRGVFAGMCVVAGLIGFVSDVRQRRDSDVEQRQSDVRMQQVISQNSTEVGNTGRILTQLSIVVPQLTAINSKIAAVELNIEAAKGNPVLLARYQVQIRALQEQAQNVQRKTLLAMEPQVANELEVLAQGWAEDWDNMKNSIQGSALHSLAPGEADRIAQQMKELPRVYMARSRPVFVSADELRVELLQFLPPDQALNEEDKSTPIFQNASVGYFSFSDLFQASDYLNSLAKKVSSLP